jgi:hypothetical protein
MDGENPGSLQAQLQRTKESQGKANPAYPPGTMSLGSRRYLIVTRPVTWDEAVAFASNGGGHLAVPADKAENDLVARKHHFPWLRIG